MGVNSVPLAAEIEDIGPGSGVLLLRLIGEIDMATSDEFRRALSDLADRRPTDVIIDASGVSFMDSTGLHALIEGKRVIHDARADIILVCSPQVRRILELMFPAPLFASRVDTMEEALTALADRDDGSTRQSLSSTQ